MNEPIGFVNKHTNRKNAPICATPFAVIEVVRIFPALAAQKSDREREETRRFPPIDNPWLQLFAGPHQVPARGEEQQSRSNEDEVGH
jgi:hypothetical protein